MSSIALGARTPHPSPQAVDAGQSPARRAPRPARPPQALRLTRRGRLTVFVAVLGSMLAASLFVLADSATGTAEPGEPVPVRMVQVEAGDTLWSIATRTAPGEDPRDLIDHIQELNAIDGSLRVGTELAVPVDG